MIPTSYWVLYNDISTTPTMMNIQNNPVTAFTTTTSSTALYPIVVNSAPIAAPVSRFPLGKGLFLNVKSDYFELEFPENFNVEDFILKFPKALRLLDVNGNVLEIREDGSLYTEKLKNASKKYIDIEGARLSESLAFSHFKRIQIPRSGGKIILPNDATINLDHRGNFTFDDTQSKFFYKPQPREFNQYVNASDQLEAFIRYLGTQGVRQKNVMRMPLGLFIHWLIIEAAKADGDDYLEEEPKLIEDLKEVKAQPRCLYCKRFISRLRHEKGINYCNADHFNKYLKREGLTL